MKLSRNLSPVQRGGVKQESVFSIKTSSHAFEILSSGLYTDSVSAIVRELSCNAYDSHVAAGNADAPFDIHVPTHIEPWFSIRDYGTGLSNEDVLEIYTTYFHSTKSDSDDFIGALGLGSKSPFSYSTDFQVTSYYEGTEYKYAIFLNESGVPSVALLGEIETTAPNGVEVRIPSDDSYRFSTAIGRYLAYFKVKPNIYGIDMDEIETAYQSSRKPTGSELDCDGKWFVCDKESGYSSSRVGVIYGQVPYPVNSDRIRSGVIDICTTEEIEFYNKFSNRVVFIFDVGALSITANREELKYDDSTLAMFGERIKEMHGMFSSKIKNAIENYEHNDSLYKINRYLMQDFFNDDVNFYKTINPEDIDCPAFAELWNHKSQWGSRFTYQVGAALIDAKAMHYKAMYLDSYYSQVNDEERIRAKNNGNVDCLGISKPVVYYVVDEGRNGVAKAKQDFGKRYDVSQKTDYVILKPHDIRTIDKSFCVQELAEIKNKLGNPDFVFTSSLTYTPPVRKKSTTSKKQIGTVFSSAPYWHNKTDLIFENGGIYVYLAGGKTLYRGSKAIIENDIFGQYGKSKKFLCSMIDIYNEVNGTEYTIADLIGVSAADIKDFDKDSGWTNIIDTVEDYVKKNQKAMHLKLQESKTFIRSFKDIGDTLSNRTFTKVFTNIADMVIYNEYIDIINRLDTTGDFYKNLEKYASLKKKFDEHIEGSKGIDEILMVFADTDYRSVSELDNRFTVNMEKELSLMDEKYPMIHMINSYQCSIPDKTTLQTVIDYIIMSDNN